MDQGVAPTGGPTSADVARMLSGNRGANIGPYVLGFAIDLMLFGLMTSQVSHWWMWGKGDKKLIKGLVISGAIAATAVTGFNIAYMFHLFVWGYADWLTIIQVDYMLNHMIISVAVITIVQIFYLGRAYALNRTIILPIFVVGGILVSLGGAISARIIGSSVTSSTEENVIMKSFYCWLGGTLLVDVILTGTIADGLWNHRTGWEETKKLITKLIRISFEAQVPPTIIAIIMLVLFGTNFPSAWPIGLEIFHNKVYFTGMMAVLNARLGMRSASGSGKQSGGEGAVISGGSAVQQATVVVRNDKDIFSHRESIKLSPIYASSRSKSALDEVYSDPADAIITTAENGGPTIHHLPSLSEFGNDSRPHSEMTKIRKSHDGPARSAHSVETDRETQHDGESQTALRRAQSGEELLISQKDGRMGAAY